MPQPRPIPRRHGFGRLLGLLTLGLLGAAAALGDWVVFGQQPLPAQDLLSVELSRGESKPMRIYGSHITDWREGNERVILTRGKVYIEQDLVRLCLQEGIVWIAEEKTKEGTVYHLDIYGEKTDLEQGNMHRTAAKIRVKMHTVGILFKTFAGNIQHESARADPLFARALAVRRMGGVPSVATPAHAIMPQNGPASPSVPKANTSEILQAGAQLSSPGSISLANHRLSADGSAPPPSPALGQSLPGPPDPGPAPMGSAALAAPPVTQPIALTQPPPAALPQQPSIPVQVVPVPGLPQQPGQPPAPATPIPTLPTPVNAKPEGPVRIVNIRSRTGGPWSASKVVQPNGESLYIIPTGIIVTVRDAATNKTLIDIEADHLVYWSKEGKDKFGDPLQKMQSPEGQKTNTMEFYLSGHVQIRNQQSPKETQTMRADEVYYDVSRNVAVAINADVELISKASIYPAHFKAEEVHQLGLHKFEGVKAEIYASLIPSDPGIKILFDKAVLEQFDTPRTNIFGRTFTKLKTGEPLTAPQKIISGDNAVVYVEGIPISYFPKFRTDADDPLGPLDAVGFNYSTIFGFQVLTTWNMFDLLGIVPDPGKRWQLYGDYMTARGPAVGTTYQDAGKNLFGDILDWTNKYELRLKLYGIHDMGTDQIGGTRGFAAPATPFSPIPLVPVEHSDWRGRATGQLFVTDLPNNFTFLGQFSAISDQNFLDQFFNQEWLTGLNQDTFAYLKQQRDYWYWSFMLEDRIRPWITETNWLPRLDGYVAGVDLFNFLTWSSKVGAGYAQLNTTNAAPGAYLNTDVPTNTARLDWWQEFSAPFSVGDARVVPYAIGDLTYYSRDLAGQEIGRAYGGIGLRGSVPLSKLYPDVNSDLLNLDGLFHKIVMSGNYYLAHTNVSFNDLPQLDRLNDDASDQALRNIHPLQAVLNPGSALFLTTSKLFDPQFYALQRLVFTQVDTLDSIDVLQLNLTQRLQTKRGIAGDEHVVDWMFLDLGVSIFPQAQRDNLNQPIGILSYDWIWNVGDRTSFFSNGWMDPVAQGPHFWTIGAAYNRPDRTNLTVAYRQIDPLQSKAVILSGIYPLSAKYAVTGSTMYDFGVHTQTNTIMLTRIGTDLRASVGFSYNSILNNFSFVFEIVPNLIPNAGRSGFGGGGAPGSGSGGIGNASR